MGDKDHIEKIIQVSILLLEMVLVVAIHIKEHQHMLEKEHPDHFAVKQYRKFKLAAGDVCSK